MEGFARTVVVVSLITSASAAPDLRRSLLQGVLYILTSIGSSNCVDTVDSVNLRSSPRHHLLLQLSLLFLRPGVTHPSLARATTAQTHRLQPLTPSRFTIPIYL
ncbi:V-type proton ATPase subunit B 1-like [Iris pallida]|uniref:V-type proton ATPase subunit B 1-like n=1 Tax=Iris pallida TaxID=29817 RepID=A0AAX6E7M9_IRIPA|nr:V-type proton ATPase subunit B 1-like [Iris pallida]